MGRVKKYFGAGKKISTDLYFFLGWTAVLGGLGQFLCGVDLAAAVPAAAATADISLFLARELDRHVAAVAVRAADATCASLRPPL